MTRARVDQIADDMTDLKLRMSGLESGMVLVKRKITHGDETAARQQITIDRLATRVERIERRLELSGPPRGTDHATPSIRRRPARSPAGGGEVRSPRHGGAVGGNRI